MSNDDDDARDALKRLRGKASRERTRFNKIEESSMFEASKERARGESNVCSIFIGWIDEELERIT